MADRTFTPSEANSALEQVRPLAERMVELAAAVAAAAAERQELQRAVSRNGSAVVLSAQAAAAPGPLAELEGCLAELAGLGVEVKDIATGLLDFPALREGEEVLLCWRLGEPAVSFWHRREDGFAGRRPIDWDQPD